MELNSLLTQFTERNASDLHLAVGVPPIFRVDGALVPGEKPNLTPEALEAFLLSALPEEKLAGARRGQDFSATLSHVGQTFRCQVFRERGHLAAALRVLPSRVPTLEELSLPPIFEKLTHYKRGLILVVGPTGSGKTTTLVSMLEHINLTRGERICTVEDPMHYVLSSKLSLVTQRVVAEDVESYEQGLLSAMDSDPDVVLIGELRTASTARLALEMAETGHLVLSQMTAETVADAIDRVLTLLGEPSEAARRLLARTMQAIIAQKLLRREDRAGRVAANEILLASPRVRQMIAEGQTDAALLALVMETEVPMGMQTMNAALRGYQANGIISRDSMEIHLTKP